MTILKIIAIFSLGVLLIAWKITSDIRKSSEQKVRNEQTITDTRNRQILAGQEIIKKYEEEREQTQRDREFCRSLDLASDCLEEKRRQAEKDRKLCLPLGKESDCLE